MLNKSKKAKALSKLYICLLDDIKGAPVDTVIDEHYDFWSDHSNAFKNDPNNSLFRAYHLGTIPTSYNNDIAEAWFTSSSINLQRVGLYSDVLVFDDILGNILSKLYFIPNNERINMQYHVDTCINMLLSLKNWVDADIVEFCPPDNILGNIFETENYRQLNSLTYDESNVDLPDKLIELLTEEQQSLLGVTSGYALAYKVNKAIFLKQTLGFIPSADDTFFKVLCEKLNWESKFLSESRNLYVVKKIKSNYLCNSKELVLHLRKEDSLFSMRKFLRESIHNYFGDDIKYSQRQEVIDEFSLELSDNIHQANDELRKLKKKLSDQALLNASVLGVTSGLLTAVDFGPQLASWIPQLVPTTIASKGIFDAIKNYISNYSDLKRKPAFLLGTFKEKQ